MFQNNKGNESRPIIIINEYKGGDIRGNANQQMPYQQNIMQMQQMAQIMQGMASMMHHGHPSNALGAPPGFNNYNQMPQNALPPPPSNQQINRTPPRNNHHNNDIPQWMIDEEEKVDAHGREADDPEDFIDAEDAEYEIINAEEEMATITKSYSVLSVGEFGKIFIMELNESCINDILWRGIVRNWLDEAEWRPDDIVVIKIEGRNRFDIISAYPNVSKKFQCFNFGTKKHKRVLIPLHSKSFPILSATFYKVFKELVDEDTKVFYFEEYCDETDDQAISDEKPIAWATTTPSIFPGKRSYVSNTEMGYTVIPGEASGHKGFILQTMTN